MQDLLFLPGFNSPTLALLCSPTYTWAGKFRSHKDTYVLEIRTFDFSSGGSFPLLTSVTGLPSDSLYLVACPTSVGGIVVVTTNGIVHVDSKGRLFCASVNAWWSLSTNLLANTKDAEDRKLSLEGSRAEFVSENDMLLILQNGDAHQVRFEMDGRSVRTIKVDAQSSAVPPPSTLVSAGPNGLFIGSAEGDSLLAKVNMVQDKKDESEAAEENKDMEVDWDEGEGG